MEATFQMLLYRAFHAQRTVLRPHLTELGLGTGQPKLLGYLSTEGSCSQRELAEYFEIDPAAVSRMLDGLQRSGFVTRREDARNRRRELIEITDSGRAVYTAWRGCCREMEEQMLRDFTPEERAQFADYLARARRNLRQGEGERET